MRPVRAFGLSRPPSHALTGRAAAGIRFRPPYGISRPMGFRAVRDFAPFGIPRPLGFRDVTGFSGLYPYLRRTIQLHNYTPARRYAPLIICRCRRGSCTGCRASCRADHGGLGALAKDAARNRAGNGAADDLLHVLVLRLVLDAVY